MANTLNLGTDGNWAIKEGALLGYNSESSNFKPLPFNFTRASTATYIAEDGLIKTAASGVPRIDFLDSTEGSLKLEPQRTNSLLQSNQFDTTWSLSSSIGLTSEKPGIGGEVNAWLLKKTDSASRYINQTISLSSLTYSYSVFAKKESGNWLYVRLADSGGSLASISYFDLENGVIGSTSADSISIKNYNDGWYRCEVIFTHSVGNVRMYPAVSNGAPSGGSGGEGIYIYGAMLEQGSYPTSYIKTSGSTATRVADACSQTVPDGIINSTEGVLYAEISALADDSVAEGVSISDGTINNRVVIFKWTASNTIRVRVASGGTNYFESTVVVSDITAINKIAVKYKANDFSLWINGIEIDTDVSGITPIGLSELNINGATVASAFYGNVKDVRVYNTALTDTELATLTTI